MAIERNVATESPTLPDMGASESKVVGTPSSPAPPKGEIDAATPERSNEGELWLISHYTAGANYGNASYPYGSPTASGIPAQPGVVACGVGYLRKTIRLAGWNMVCADTGNPNYVYEGVADIWCYSFDSWGPTEPEFSNEWWYGLRCPSPCEAEINGRCYARVIE
jgi:hypothetical protein